MKLLLLIVLLYCLNNSQSSCPNQCSHRGNCDQFSRCLCGKGFQGADCSERVCPFGIAWVDQTIGNDLAHSSAECSNRGICDRIHGKCECMDGFTGAACERLTCSKNCNGRGQCYKMENLALRTRNDLSQSFVYNLPWDAEKIEGCHCDLGYAGFDCSLQVCPSGDDPLTTGQVNEVQLIQCIGNAGSFVLFYKGLATESIPFDADIGTVTKALLSIPFLTGIKVTYSIPNSVACQIYPNVIFIEFTEQFGPQNPLVPQMDSVLTESGGNIVVVADGTTQLKDELSRKFTSTVGNKENDVCANRGICDPIEGVCSCFNTNGDAYGSSNGYGQAGSRGDCGYVLSASTTTVASCPGDLSCSGHGVCDITSFRCTCASGWFGGDCSLMQCPTGLSWFSYPTADNTAHNDYALCANMGICDTVTGKCQCRDNFYGEACEYMGCGGGLSNPCNGHGRCMSMSELALWATNNGDEANYVYGSDVNNPYTWDYDRVHGCLCDVGYSGYDCSLKVCPIGDDPGTYDDHVEVQLLQCIADGGNFTVTFREQTTGWLSFNSTSTEIREALSQLSSINYGIVGVFFTYDGPPPNGTLNDVKPFKTDPDGFPSWAKFSLNETVVPLFINHTLIGRYPYKDSAFCTTDGTQIAIISFDSTQGPLPPLHVDVSRLQDIVNNDGTPGTGRVQVYRGGQSVFGITSISGTTETELCNQRGICDTETGLCKCFPTWTSSDGTRQGGPGYVNDCGTLIE